MLTVCFRDPRTLHRLRDSRVGPFLDDFACSLADAGYVPGVIEVHVRGAVTLGSWLAEQDVAIKEIDGATLARFAEHLAERGRLRYANGDYRRDYLGARSFCVFLSSIGLIDAAAIAVPVNPEPQLVVLFRQWMREHRGVKDSTLAGYARVLIELVTTVGDRPEAYDIRATRGFALQCASRSMNPVTAKTAITAIRMFLRFLSATGRSVPGLEHGIPSIARWRLSSLPKYLQSEQIERIIGACDTSTALGMRDKAIVLLGARLGLRAGDIAGLSLSDIDWRSATIKVAGKSRREVRLPLPQEVGDALLHYLEHGRPQTACDAAFVTTVAPIRPIRGQTVSKTACRSMVRAGVDAPSHGAHLLRHSAATAMLRDGASLQTIGVVLRHASVEMTAHYAKVDISLLKQVAPPWPEVAPC